MEKKAENSTTNYAPEKVTEAVEIHFTKIVSGGNTTISGTIKKGSADAGTVQLKPYNALTADEVTAVYAAVPGCITEMLND